MPLRPSLTRRQALLGATAAAASLATVGVRPRHSLAQPTGPTLPIPKLIEARNDTPVRLTLQRGMHSFGNGRAAPSSGI
jgi:hypothetical protein